MTQLKPAKKKTTNDKFTDKEWYVSLAADALDLKFASLAKSLGKALNPKIKDTEKELLSLYELAFENSLQCLGIEVNIKSKNNQALFTDHIIDPNFPSYHPIFNELSKIVELSYLRCDDELFTSPWSELKIRLRSQFASSFQNMLLSTVESHPNAISYIEHLKTYIEPIESQAIAHMNSVIHDVEHECLAIDPELTLRKSYVTPTCSVILNKIKGSNSQKESKENLILSLIECIKKSNHPIILHGQPGHGKTSTAKILISALTRSYESDGIPITVLFYEFKSLRSLSDPILKVLHSVTPFLEDSSFFNNKNTTIILDGLDERQLADGSDDILRTFVSGLILLAKTINEKVGSKLNLVFTGRSQYVAQIKSCFNMDHWHYEIEDFSEIKIKQWLQRFNSQKSNTKSITLNQLKTYQLKELISQPILLTISSILLCDKDGQKLLKELSGSKINRNQIYKVIIDWSYDKKWQKIPNTSNLCDKLSLEDYTTLLQAIAFEMFKSGEESIRLSELAKALHNNKIHDLSFLENKNVEYIEQVCSQLRISFFFKGFEDKAFSFLHKSIKDFLIVSGVFEVFHKLVVSCNPKRLDKEAAELFEILSGSAFSYEDHIPMLSELLEQEHENLSVSSNKLLAIWERISNQDFSISFETPAQTLTASHNIIYNYYAIISRYFSRQTKLENIKSFGCDKVILFDNNSSNGFSFIPFTYFVRLLDSSLIENEHLIFKNQKIHPKSHLEGHMNFRLFRHDFSNTTFSNVSFMGLHAVDCNFNNTEMIDVWMGNSTFSGCNFSGSKIDSIMRNVFNSSFPLRISYFNKFIHCDFSHSELLDNKSNQETLDNITNETVIFESGETSRSATQFLFWDCNFKSATFKCFHVSDVIYSDKFIGTKLPQSQIITNSSSNLNPF